MTADLGIALAVLALIGILVWMVAPSVMTQRKARQLLEGLPDGWFDESRRAAKIDSFRKLVDWYMSLNDHRRGYAHFYLRQFIDEAGTELSWRAAFFVSAMQMPEFAEQILRKMSDPRLQFDSRGSKILCEAARQLGAKPDPRTQTAIMSALGQMNSLAPGDQRRHLAVFACACSQMDRAADIRRLLEDRDPPVRLHAAVWFAVQGRQFFGTGKLPSHLREHFDAAQGVVSEGVTAHVRWFRQLGAVLALPQANEPATART